MNWTTSPCAALNINAQHEAEAHQAQLTKPAGSGCRDLFSGAAVY